MYNNFCFAYKILYLYIQLTYSSTFYASIYPTRENCIGTNEARPLSNSDPRTQYSCMKKPPSANPFDAEKSRTTAQREKKKKIKNLRSVLIPKKHLPGISSGSRIPLIFRALISISSRSRSSSIYAYFFFPPPLIRRKSIHIYTSKEHIYSRWREREKKTSVVARK